VKLALLLLLVAVTTACKDKAKAPAAEPARTAPPVLPAAPPAPPAEPPAAPPPAPPVVDAGEPLDAPPTTSELALAARAEFFSKVAKTSKRGAGDCRALLAELESFGAEARAMSQRRADVTGAEVTQDDAMVATTLRAMIRIVSACPEKERFDAFLNTLADTPR